MKILLDECVPKRLRVSLPGHTVETVTEAGWSGIKNGDLLTRAASRFDVFITVDSNLRFQQHLPRFAIAVVLLSAPSNKLASLAPLAPRILAVLPALRPGTLSTIG